MTPATARVCPAAPAAAQQSQVPLHELFGASLKAVGGMAGAGDGALASAFDIDIEALPDKPWRRAGSDMSDYFNYGFTEASWIVRFRSRAPEGVQCDGRSVNPIPAACYPRSALARRPT